MHSAVLLLAERGLWRRLMTENKQMVQAAHRLMRAWIRSLIMPMPAACIRKENQPAHSDMSAPNTPEMMAKILSAWHLYSAPMQAVYIRITNQHSESSVLPIPSDLLRMPQESLRLAITQMIRLPVQQVRD